MGDVGKVALGIATGGTSYVADETFFAPGRRSARFQRRAARAEGEAREVSAAQQETERQAAIRKQVREERVRRAQVLSAAEASGVSGSSVEASTIGSGQTLAASGQAFATGATLTAGVQSDLLQQAADFKSEALQAEATGKVWKSAFDLGTTAFKMGAGG